MINELYALHSSLKKHGIDVPFRHPWLQGIKKGDALVVTVDERGKVASLEYCSPEQVATLWNVKKSNHSTFPAINFKPFFTGLNHNRIQKKIFQKNGAGDFSCFLEYGEAILKNSYVPNWTKANKKNVWNRLYNFSHTEILPKLSESNSSFASLIHCFDSLDSFSESDIDGLCNEITRKLLNDLKKGRLDCFGIAQSLLIGKPGANSQTETTIIFNNSNRKILVADSSELSALNNSFENITKTKGKADKFCSLTGALAEVVNSKFPEPNFPELGPSYIMSMNKDDLCHYRYQRISTEIFPLSKDVANKLENVSIYITDPERKFKTWMPVGNEKGKRDLLIAYAEEIPALNNENLALLMGGDSSGEQRFESISSIVCNALREFQVADTTSKFRFFIIRKIDKGRRQIVLTDFCSFPQLVNAVQSWNKAAKNHPPISIFLPGKKGTKATRHQPSIPFPSDLTRLLQYQWIRDGTESHKLNGCSLVMVYDLFFERWGRTRSTARQVLQMLLQRLTPLLAGFGRAQHLNNYELLNEYTVFAKKAVLQAFSIIGIVLFKLGHQKEVYMKDAGYNIGRMLSLTDCLHKEYCRHVRKDDIPNQLLGNTFLRTVLDSPVRGLARLSERIAVYKAWIDRSHGEEFKLAHWATHEMGRISERLSDLALPDTTDDAMKAQILLGYLAHTESNK